MKLAIRRHTVQHAADCHQGTPQAHGGKLFKQRLCCRCPQLYSGSCVQLELNRSVEGKQVKGTEGLAPAGAAEAGSRPALAGHRPAALEHPRCAPGAAERAAARWAAASAGCCCNREVVRRPGTPAGPGAATCWPAGPRQLRSGARSSWRCVRFCCWCAGIRFSACQQDHSGPSAGLSQNSQQLQRLAELIMLHSPVAPKPAWSRTSSTTGRSLVSNLAPAAAA